MKKILIILATLMMMPITYAYDAEEIEAQIQERMEETREALDLSDEQLEEIRQIFEKSIERQREVFAKYGIDGEGGASGLKFREKRQLRKDIGAVRKSTNEELSEVLKEEQMEKYQELAEQRRAEMREKAEERRK